MCILFSYCVSLRFLDPETAVYAVKAHLPSALVQCWNTTGANGNNGLLKKIVRLLSRLFSNPLRLSPASTPSLLELSMRVVAYTHASINSLPPPLQEYITSSAPNKRCSNCAKVLFEYTWELIALTHHPEFEDVLPTLTLFCSGNGYLLVTPISA